jgi:hypothetical protein
MNTLNVEQRLEIALRGVAELRTLAANKTKVRYEAFARAIGLMSSTDVWEARHNQQVTAILSIMGAVERQGLGGKDRTIAPLEFEWIVDRHGKPGAGFAKNSRIVRKKP